MVIPFKIPWIYHFYSQLISNILNYKLVHNCGCFTFILQANS